MSKIGAALLKARKQIKMSQATLSERSGVSTQMISLIENGQRNGSPDLWEKLATGIGLPLSVVLWLSTEESSVPLERVESYRALKPTVDNLISTIFQINLQ